MATAACARVLGAVEERTVATESCVRVRWVAEEERTAATSISTRVHGAAASRGGAALTIDYGYLERHLRRSVGMTVLLPGKKQCRRHEMRVQK